MTDWSPPCSRTPCSLALSPGFLFPGSLILLMGQAGSGGIAAVPRAVPHVLCGQQ